MRALAEEVLDRLLAVADHEQVYRDAALPQGALGDLDVRGVVFY